MERRFPPSQRMKLKDLLGDAPEGQDWSDIVVTGVTSDSREVKPGFLFAALPGVNSDGASYIGSAIESGAAAILLSDSASQTTNGATRYIRDPNPRRRFAMIAGKFYDTQPDTVIAVTGTNGKTSVASFVRQIWETLGRRAASLGTVGLVSPLGDKPVAHTTPDPAALHAMLAELATGGVDALALEASSHGLEQHRLDGVRIAAAAFTNITRDHLDYHKSFRAYFDAKLRLFDLLPAGAPAIINADQLEAAEIAGVADDRRLDVLTVGRLGAGIKLIGVEQDSLSQRLTVRYQGKTYKTLLPLAGDFQASNALIAAGLAIKTGGEPSAVFAALETLHGAKGRLELAGRPANGAPVFIDYAHTPDALEKALQALRPYATRKLAVVFGCGGDRDRGKRPQMGAIASRLADVVYVTDDNPRSENPATIRADILAEAPRALEVGDRMQAIAQAVAALQEGDVLLVAGKGHETGQIVAGQTIPFSDHDAVRDALAALARAPESVVADTVAPPPPPEPEPAQTSEPQRIEPGSSSPEPIASQPAETGTQAVETTGEEQPLASAEPPPQADDGPPPVSSEEPSPAPEMAEAVPSAPEIAISDPDAEPVKSEVSAEPVEDAVAPESEAPSPAQADDPAPEAVLDENAPATPEPDAAPGPADAPDRVADDKPVDPVVTEALPEVTATPIDQKAPLWTFDKILAATKGSVQGARPEAATGISIDSRTLAPGDLFVAIKGERQDGHDYVTQVLRQGAAAAIVSKDYFGAAGPLVRVPNPLEALNALGRASRARTEARIIAVTGSVGKTSTKEMLRLALRVEGAAHASEKSYNNLWGVPLSLARMPQASKFGIFEIGMNHAGEITPLTRLVRPHVAIITNVAAVHLEFFKDEEAIAEAKAEIFHGLEPGGIAIINRDLPHSALLERRAREAGAEKVIGFGEYWSSESRIVKIDLLPDRSRVTANIMGDVFSYDIGAPGRHLAMNSLAVLTAVKCVGGNVDIAAASLAAFETPDGRGVRTRFELTGGAALLIDESYNANPASMRAAIAVLEQMPRAEFPRRIAVLGDMLELGHGSAELHAKLAEPIDEADIDVVFACGPHMQALFDALPPAKRGGYAQSAAELAPAIISEVKAGDAVMVKGSLGSKTGLIVSALSGHLSAQVRKSERENQKD